jgi:hypothetical protein
MLSLGLCACVIVIFKTHLPPMTGNETTAEATTGSGWFSDTVSLRCVNSGAEAIETI